MESPPKKKLPFKRTVRRKSIEVPTDDALSLFSRSGQFFEEQQKLLDEKAEREKAEKEKVEREKAEEAARKAREEKETKAKQRRKERSVHDSDIESIDLLDEKPIREPGSAKKRRRISSTHDDDEFTPHREYKPSKKQRSPSPPLTPTSKRKSSFTTPRAGRRLTRNQARASLISLDDDPFAPTSSSDLPSTKLESAKKPIKLESKQDVIALDDDSEPEVITGQGQKENEEEDPSEYYIRLARERAEKEKAEREARQKRDSAAVDEDDPIIQILIHSHMRGINTFMFRRRLSQRLNVVYQTWVEQQIVKNSNVPRPVLETMFFTWKGNKVYPHTTLKTLGIKPERDGSLYPDWKPDQEGYRGRDKVFFEAWTQQLYDEYLEEKEKQRLQHLNELEGVYEGSQEPELPQTSQEEKKIRVHFKAKDKPPTKVTVRPSTTAAQLVKAYQRLANIPEDQTIELHWDGEVLDDETTVEEADIEDMDSLEVHIK